MAHRILSETGFYHATTRAAGQIALFEDDADRRYYLRLLKDARNETGVTIIAWVLMTDHVHLVIDCRDKPELICRFMFSLDARYTRYFNAKTGRTGTLFQGAYWSKPILDDAHLIATVYYVHMNPAVAGIAPMRAYRWSSYMEYAGKHWVVDTRVVLAAFGSFEAFDAYEGSPKDVVSRHSKPKRGMDDGDVLARAIELAGVATSSELRLLPREKRNEVVRTLYHGGASVRKIARTFGIGASTVSRILKS